MCALISANASASSFSILDTNNRIVGRLFSADLGVSDQFDLRSSSPIYNKIVDALHPNLIGNYSFAESHAAGSFVSVAMDEPGASFRVPASAAEAISTITFKPNFSGAASDILFLGVGAMDGWIDGPKASWTITDLTTNALVAVNGSNRGDFSQLLTYGDFGSSGSNYSWDATHIYQLEMLVHTSSNHGTDGGWLSTNMFSVAEPSSLLLLVCGVGALLGVKSRPLAGSAYRRRSDF